MRRGRAALGSMGVQGRATSVARRRRPFLFPLHRGAGRQGRGRPNCCCRLPSPTSAIPTSNPAAAAASPLSSATATQSALRFVAPVFVSICRDLFFLFFFFFEDTCVSVFFFGTVRVRNICVSESTRLFAFQSDERGQRAQRTRTSRRLDPRPTRALSAGNSTANSMAALSPLLLVPLIESVCPYSRLASWEHMNRGSGPPRCSPHWWRDAALDVFCHGRALGHVVWWHRSDSDRNPSGRLPGPRAPRVCGATPAVGRIKHVSGRYFVVPLLEAHESAFRSALLAQFPDAAPQQSRSRDFRIRARCHR